MPQEKAKLFMKGGSQAILLPEQFRFTDDEVYIRRDPSTGEVILSSRPDSWDDFLALFNDPDPAAVDFLKDRSDPPPKKRDLF